MVGGGHSALGIGVAEQALVDAGETLVVDLAAEGFFDLAVGARAKIEGDDLGGALAQTLLELPRLV